MPRMSYLYILMASSFTFFRSLFKSSSQQTCLSTLFNFSNPYLLPTTFTQASSLINTNSADLFSSVQSLSCVWLFATPWTAARQASLSITNSCSLFKLTLLHFSCAFFIFLIYSNTYFVDYLLSPLEQNLYTGRSYFCVLLRLVSDSFAQYLEHVLSRVWLYVTPWTVACQAPRSMEFSQQEYWNGLLFPPPGDLPDPGLNLHLRHWQADSLPLVPPGKPHLECIG